MHFLRGDFFHALTRPRNKQPESEFACC